MTTNELIQEITSRFAELKTLPVTNTSAVTILRRWLGQLNALDNNAEANSLKAEIDSRIALYLYVGQKVSLRGQFNYDGEVIDILVTITEFREDPSKRDQMLVDYRMDKRSVGCTLLDGAETMLSLGKGWKIVYHVETERDANPVLTVERIVPPQS